MKTILKLLGLQRIGTRHIIDVQGSLELAKQMHPIGSIQHSNYPKAGLYSVVGHRYVAEWRTTSVFGKLLLQADSLGDHSTGILIEQILNGKRKFGRGPEGRWEVQ